MARNEFLPTKERIPPEQAQTGQHLDPYAKHHRALSPRVPPGEDSDTDRKRRALARKGA